MRNRLAARPKRDTRRCVVEMLSEYHNCIFEFEFCLRFYIDIRHTGCEMDEV